MQPVEAEEVVVDGEHVDAREAGVGRELAHGVGAQDRAERGRGLLDQLRRQAVRDAPAVHHALDLVAGRGEALGDALVDDEDGAVGGERRAGGAQRLDGAREVVQRLEDRTRS